MQKTMQTPDDFCAFILSHGRPDNVLTLDLIKRCGYTGKVFIVIDDEDPTGDQYRQNFGNSYYNQFTLTPRYDMARFGAEVMRESAWPTGSERIDVLVGLQGVDVRAEGQARDRIHREAHQVGLQLDAAVLARGLLPAPHQPLGHPGAAGRAVAGTKGRR